MFHCTLTELRQRLTRPELLLWVAAYETEPWGEVRQDLAAGQIAAVVATCHSTKRTFKPSDFMPDFTRRLRPPQSPEDMQAVARQITALLGGAIR